MESNTTTSLCQTPSKPAGLPATPDVGQSSVTPGEAARRSAAARAYALSSSCAGKDVTPQQQSQTDEYNYDDFSSNNPYLPPRSKTPTRGANHPHRPKTLMASPALHTHAPISTKYKLEELEEVGDADYANFMRSLLVDDLDAEMLEREMDTEDDEDYQCDEEDEEEDENEEEDDNEAGEKGHGSDMDGDADEHDLSHEKRGGLKMNDNDNDNVEERNGGSKLNPDSSNTATTTSKDIPNHGSPKDLLQPISLDDTDLFLDPIALEEELGSLLEEDMEAAVNSLLQQQQDIPSMGSNTGMSGNGIQNDTAMSMSSSSISGVTTPHRTTSHSPKVFTPTHKTQDKVGMTVTPKSDAASKAASSASKFPTPSEDQMTQLRNLMNQHYQILLQQATLAVRAAHGNKFKVNHRGSNKRKRVESFFCCGETADDLAGILDGAVTMLQDLDKNRKDAIRYSIQMRRVRARKNLSTDMSHSMTMTSNFRNSGNGQSFFSGSAPSAARAILGDECETNQEQGILTRSAFSRTLRESDWIVSDGHANQWLGTGGVNGNDQRIMVDPCMTTVFGVRGLARLNETFSAIDNSISAYSEQNGAEIGSVALRPMNRMSDADNIFYEPNHGRACEMLLHHARADYDRNLIPGYRDLAYLLTYPSEIMGTEIGMPMSPDQQKMLRQNKLQFTAAEDNLLLRGVNLYGEKEWIFISDRFLPDRSVSVIAQRYWRLCLLIYKGHGVQIDPSGKLQERHLPNGIEDLDERAVERALKPVKKPIVYGLYRWTMEEDLLLLKAVPIMGRMFAEIGKRFIPYRDRGALRKRYQVLERRVKGAMKRDKKTAIETKKRGNAAQKNAKQSAATDQSELPLFYPKNPPSTSIAQQYVGGFFPRPMVHNNNTLPVQRAPLIPPPPPPPPHPPVPQPVYPPVPKNSNDSYSAFGRVIEGEWSQFSKTVEEIIDENASTLQCIGNSQIPGSQPAQYLPNLDYNNDSLSGLSALAGTDSNIGNMRKGDSIMKLVMHQSMHPALFHKSKGEEQVSFKKDEMSGPQEDLPSDDHHELDQDMPMSYQRILPPSSQINSNISFFGSGATMSHQLDHSLMAPPEFDAVSALNQMSNCSIDFKPPNSYQKDYQKNENVNGKKTSFFEKVVGGNNKK